MVGWLAGFRVAVNGFLLLLDLSGLSVLLCLEDQSSVATASIAASTLAAAAGIAFGPAATSTGIAVGVVACRTTSMRLVSLLCPGFPAAADQCFYDFLPFPV